MGVYVYMCGNIKNYIGATKLHRCLLCLIKGRNAVINIGPIYSQHLSLLGASENYSKICFFHYEVQIKATQWFNDFMKHASPALLHIHRLGCTYAHMHAHIGNIIPLRCILKATSNTLTMLSCLEKMTLIPELAYSLRGKSPNIINLKLRGL